MPDPKDVDVTIRAAEAADIEALADLMTQLGYETRASEMQMRMEAIRANKNYATFVAISKGKVCGMIGTFTCLLTSTTVRRRGFWRWSFQKRCADEARVTL